MNTIIVHGQETQGITIEPFMQTLRITEDQSEQQFELTVTNMSTAEYPVRFSVVDFGQLDESGGVALVGTQASELQKKYGLASWLELEKDFIVVAPGQSQTVRGVVRNRQSLSPGGHYAAIVGTVESEQANNGNNISVRHAFTSLMFVVKKGGEKYNLKLENVEHNGSLFTLPDAVELTLNNRGNVHTVPRGVIQVNDMAGSAVSKGIVNYGSATALPETLRTFPTELRPLKYAWMPGVYTLNIQYRYDEREEFTTVKEPLVYVGPYASGALVLIVSGAVFIAGKRKKKRQEKRAHEHNK